MFVSSSVNNLEKPKWTKGKKKKKSNNGDDEQMWRIKLFQFNTWIGIIANTLYRAKTSN